MNFCENLKKEMEYRKISQTELAKRLNISQATVNRWTKGINQPDFQNLFCLCEILETTPNELLGWDNA